MLDVISFDYDARLRSYCATVKTNYRWFIKVSSGAEENLKIQRKIISGTKPYATLRSDLKRGCILPPLVLAAKNIDVELDSAGESPEQLAKKKPRLSASLADLSFENTYIIDGLQRTNAIRQTSEELEGAALEQFLDRSLRVEVWINIPFGALAYRMLLLNAGQRPMSMKHQVEILSMKLKEELSTIDGIDIFTSIEGRRRTQPGQFQLAKLSHAFQAWLQGQPNIDLKNTVMEQLLAENAIETLGADVGTADKPSDGFKGLVEWMVYLDHRVKDRDQSEFFSNDNVLLGIAAAVGGAEKNSGLKPRMEACLALVKQKAADEGTEQVLAFEDFYVLRSGIDSTRRNVGEATRDLVFYAFQEFFLADGMKSMQECWRFAAGRG